jgi:NAD(P)-dependent dehydrogenase (short-subunit alcohol dehydrogenase family)
MNKPGFSLEGKVAIVTGAAGTRGIGRAIAVTLADAGANIAVCDVNLSGRDYDLEGTAEAVRKSGRRCISGKVDMTNESEIEAFIKKVVREFGSLDIMVNNAGVGALTPSIEVDRALWDKVMNINTRGCHNGCFAASQLMKEQGRGSIINISSTSGLKWLRTQYVYGVSKAGIIQITKWLGKELAQYNIRVNSIAPGGVATDINSHDIGGFDIKMDHSSMPADNKSGTPTRKIAQPADIAGVALFLASDLSGHVTGQTIVVDGGASL